MTQQPNPFGVPQPVQPQNPVTPGMPVQQNQTTPTQSPPVPQQVPVQAPIQQPIQAQVPVQQPPAQAPVQTVPIQGVPVQQPVQTQFTDSELPVQTLEVPAVPAITPVPVSTAPTQPIAHPAAPANGGNKKILIVEDELPLLKALSSKLAKENYHVLEAKNGQEGLTIANQEKPHLIISDIVMPDMNGLNMVKKVRESDWGQETEIILLTNLNNSEDVATAMLYGVEDYMVKSDMKLKDIVAKVKEKLG